MVAVSGAASASTSATRYGNVAMDHLVNDILALGGRREDLEFKVMGGGNVLDMNLDVGGHNVQFVRDYLRQHNFEIAAEDLGANFARKVFYSPRSGKVRVKRLAATVNRARLRTRAEPCSGGAIIMTKTIRVLVVDDSAVMRELLKEILNSDPGIEVVGTASDPYEARERIKALNPDVLTLDVEMPRMDGLMFLSNLMRLRPMPVVMCASITERGADLILNALDLGAVDFIAKPTAKSSLGIRDAAQEIISKVKVAAGAHLRNAIEMPKKTYRRGQRADCECCDEWPPCGRQTKNCAERQTQQDHRHRCVHRRDRGDQGSAHPAPRGHAARGDRAAHSESVQRRVRRPHGRRLQDHCV